MTRRFCFWAQTLTMTNCDSQTYGTRKGFSSTRITGRKPAGETDK